MKSISDIWFRHKGFIQKIPIVANNALFDALLSLTSVASEISILS